MTHSLSSFRKASAPSLYHLITSFPCCRLFSCSGAMLTRWGWSLPARQMGCQLLGVAGFFTSYVTWGCSSMPFSVAAAPSPPKLFWEWALLVWTSQDTSVERHSAKHSLGLTTHPKSVHFPLVGCESHIRKHCINGFVVSIGFVVTQLSSECEPYCSKINNNTIKHQW